jgi:hypothetical protein
VKDSASRVAVMENRINVYAKVNHHVLDSMVESAADKPINRNRQQSEKERQMQNLENASAVVEVFCRR